MREYVVWLLSSIPFFALVATWILARSRSFGIRLILIGLSQLVSLSLGTICIISYIFPDTLSGAQHSPGVGLELFPLFVVWTACAAFLVVAVLFAIGKRLMGMQSSSTE
jgi:hypothetical protein